MARLQKSDAIRIPVGATFLWIGPRGLLRSAPLITGDATSITVAIMSVVLAGSWQNSS